MNNARDRLRSIALGVIASEVVALAASAHAQDLSALAGLRGRLAPLTGVVMIYADRPHNSVCPQASAPARIAFSGDGGGGLAGLDHSAGSARFDREFGGDDGLQSADLQTLDLAGCEADTVRMAVVRAGPAASPEPATWALLVLGLAVIGFAARRRSPGPAFAD